jgi:hypothetical protein
MWKHKLLFFLAGRRICLLVKLTYYTQSKFLLNQCKRDLSDRVVNGQAGPFTKRNKYIKQQRCRICEKPSQTFTKQNNNFSITGTPYHNNL